jgi:hypothetical protein
MKSFDLHRPITAAALNENMFKQFKVKIDFDRYDREQLENYRNLLRSKIHATEAEANFNDLLTNETYQKDKYMLGVLNTKIKEMLGEGKKVDKFVANVKKSEKAAGKGEKKATDIAWATANKKGMLDNKNKKVKEAVVSELSPNTLKSYKDKADKEVSDHLTGQKDSKNVTKRWDGADKARNKLTKEAAKPDFLDMDKDGNKKETMKKAVADKKAGPKKGVNPFAKVKESAEDDFAKARQAKRDAEDDMWAAGKGKGDHAKSEFAKARQSKRDAEDDMWAAGKSGNRVKEAAKPDFLDMDKDGNKKEPMKKAIKDKNMKKKPVKESELKHRAYQQFIAEGIANYIAEDEEGKAKSITAAADMVNDFTSWMQRVGNYQTKSMIELADNIRANFGMQEAETFKASVGTALDGALQALTSAREEINNAVAVLAGEAPAEEPMGMDSDMTPDAEAPDEFGGFEEAPADELNMGDEFAASDAAAGGAETTGRMKRESIERGNRLMKILGA